MATTRIIDLNSDLGEAYGAYSIAPDEELFELISSANVACGFHGGDPRVMERTVAAATAHGVAVGAHPGFPDLVGFGRREIVASADEVRTDVLYQIGALDAFCRAAGVTMQHVKAHGGELRVETSLEQGTTFSVRLPRVARSGSFGGAGGAGAEEVRGE